MIGKLDKEIIEKFKAFQEKTGKHSELYIEDVEFEEKALNYIADFPAMTRISGKVDKTISEYKLLSNNEKNNYKPLISGTVENNQISGYIENIRLSKNSLSKKNVISWTRINSEIFFIQENPVCTNDDSFIMEVKKNHVIKYVQLASMIMMKYKQFNWGNKAGKTKVKEVEIPIPKDLNKFYSSYQIQEAIVEFLEFWKDGYTDIVRKSVDKKKPIYQNIKKLVVKNTFKYDKFLVDKFNKFAKDKGYNLKLKNISFKENNFFKKKQKNLLLPRKLEKNQQLILKNSVENGTPVYSGGKEKICYVDKNKYIAKIFIPLANNPDISFANNGNGSAGRNFFIHTTPYFVNQERTVISFKNDSDYYSLYIYHFIKDMRDKYNMNRDNRPTPKDLPSFKILIPTPLDTDEYSSKEIQQILVHFWEDVIGQIDSQLKIYNRMLEVTDIIDKSFLYRTFSKIDWSKE